MRSSRPANPYVLASTAPFRLSTRGRKPKSNRGRNIFAAATVDVPIGHSKRNPNDRRCRCGSQQHLTSAHRLCPLNHRVWDAALEPNVDRLRLYVPRTLARDYHVGNTVQLFEGKVTAVTNDGRLTLTFDDGDIDDVDEEDLLHIFSDMRKLRAGKRRRVSSAPCNAKRTR